MTTGRAAQLRLRIVAWASIARAWSADNWFRVAVIVILAAALTVLQRHLAFRHAEALRAADVAEERYLREATQAERAYVARRRSDCYDLYARERARFNNVVEFEYDREYDRCEVIYRKTDRSPDEMCAMARDTTTFFGRDTTRYGWNLRGDCLEGNFRKRF